MEALERQEEQIKTLMRVESGLGKNKDIHELLTQIWEVYLEAQLSGSPGLYM